MFDLNHEFFRPLAVRIIVTTIIAAWAIFEFATGAPFWGILFGSLAVWCAWSFFISNDFYNTQAEPSQNTNVQNSGNPDE